MEKKTMGSFIAALRKANGMTQRDLAERLNVSDKTVSRWECDDGAPDIALIPVIAEIFNITCDELLRGERKSPDAPQDSEPSPKAEKQRKRLFALSLAKLKNMSWIAIGVALCGLLGAMIANFGFLRANIGFFICAIFCLGSVVIQCIGLNNAFLSVADDDLDREEVGQFRHAVIKRAELTFGLVAVLIGATLPLMFVDAYIGLGTDSVLLFATLFGTIALIIYMFAIYFVNAWLLKRGIYMLNKKDSAKYHHNHKLKKKCVLILVPILIITAIAHIFVSEMPIWNVYRIMDSKKFYDYESFAAYMGEEIHYYQFETDGHYITAIPQEPSDKLYYDFEGNEITEDEARTKVLKLEDGTIVCQYVDRNEQVYRISYTEDNGSLLPIEVSTYDDLRIAQGKVLLRNIVFVIVYCLEILIAFLICMKKRVK